MIKKVIDDDDKEDGLILIGTFIQQVFGLTQEQVDDEVCFEYRFNENSATEDELQKRRTEPVVIKEVVNGEEKVTLGTRTTFQAKIPLEIERLITEFPFNISTATATIELSSNNFGDGTTLRPDLLLHEGDCRNNVSIQNLKPSINDVMLLDATGKKGRMEACEITEQVSDKIDKTKKFDFLSPYPKVFYEYENKKDYCPRFVLSFYIVESGLQKLVSIILPILLVTFVTALNVLNDYDQYQKHFDYIRSNPDGNEIPEKGEEPANHLQITSALTLTVVFILPEILDQKNRNNFFSEENSYVIIIFIALILASIPSYMAGIYPEMIGMGLMITSCFIPLLNLFRYSKILGKISREAHQLSKCRRFLSDAEYKPWKPKDGLNEFSTAGDFLKQNDFKIFKDMYQKRDDESFSKKYQRLWWNIPKSKKQKDTK